MKKFALGKHLKRDYWVGVPEGHIAEIIFTDELDVPIIVYDFSPYDLFEKMKHGDEKHQDWLKNMINEYFEVDYKPDGEKK